MNFQTAEEEPCDTVYDPEDYGGPDAIVLIAGAGLPLAGSPEPPRSGPHDVPGSQSDEFFFSHSTCSKLLCGNGRLPGYYYFVVVVFFFFPFIPKWGCGNPKRWQGGDGNLFFNSESTPHVAGENWRGEPCLSGP